MAVIDPDQDDVVIRVVYDGPPFAGKTTSVRALAQRLGNTVVAPKEIDGRTLYFDWLSYTGGLFEGRHIRCQIISVPGQAALASRRRRLLETADVVVFVSESLPHDMPAVQRYFAGLRSVLAGVSGPPVGVVLQANKRDRPDAVPLSALQSLLDSIGGRIAIVESVAIEGLGIREAFVFAVRLALDRVRELMRTNALQRERPSVDSADELLGELQRIEGRTLALAADSGLRYIPLHELAASGSADECATTAMRAGGDGGKAVPPRLPDGELPSGMIWPPVHGRVILHTAIAAPTALKSQPNGDWIGVGSSWYLHSPRTARYGTLDQGHEALVGWARMHAGSAQVISSERCVVLCADGAGQYRLWQIVRIERSLRDEFSAALAEGPEVIAKAFLTIVRAFLQAAERFAGAACWLPLSLRNVGILPGGACFLGHMPDPQNARAPLSRSQTATLKLLAVQLGYAQSDLEPVRSAVSAVLDTLIGVDDSAPLDATHEFARRFLSVEAA